MFGSGEALNYNPKVLLGMCRAFSGRQTRQSTKSLAKISSLLCKVALSLQKRFGDWLAPREIFIYCSHQESYASSESVLKCPQRAFWGGGGGWI